MKIRILGVMLFHIDKRTDGWQTDMTRTERWYVCFSYYSYKSIDFYSEQH